MEPVVSALILNYRNPLQTVYCVKELLKQTIFHPSPWPSPAGGGKIGMEVIVIDNHSIDDSIGILRNRLVEENIRIIETPQNLGFGGGYNYGARYAKGKYLLINNPAKILASSAIENMVDHFEKDDSIGILSPKILHADGTRRLSMRSFPRPLDTIIKRTILKNIFTKRMERYLQKNADPTKEHDTDWVIGGCFMISRDLFLNIGGFDERFFLFFEDIDLCRRVCRCQKRIVYDPSVTAIDKKDRLSGDGFRSLFCSRNGRIHLYSAIKYFYKWGLAP